MNLFSIPPRRHVAARSIRRSFALAVVFLAACLSPHASMSDISTTSSLRLTESWFALPRHIVVDVSPFESVDAALASLDSIDWDRDLDRARAATSAFAARELQSHLRLAGVETEIAHGRAEDGTPAVVLSAAGDAAAETCRPGNALGEQGYEISGRRGNLCISANGRVGLLYGVYALLEHLGFVWEDIHETHVPERRAVLRPRRWETISRVPRVERRGFWIYGPQFTPDDFAVWMARNRFNLGGRPRLALQRVLGIEGWAGEHDLLQQEFSRAGLFEEHPEWFAEVNGVRRPVEATGVYFNPAFASAAAADYFAERMVERLRSGDLRGVDLLNVWPADDRFNRFDQSAAAKAMGNETDNLLFFYANVARRLREAHDAGRLPRRVTLVGISYLLTMRPPTNPNVVASLARENYLHVFYPIERDWSGRFDVQLADRESNRRLLEEMNAWRTGTPFESGVVEYHNVSTLGGVALTDHLHLSANYELMISGRAGLYAYMHPLLNHPGPRRLTNLLQARLAWRSVREGRSAAPAAGTAEQETTSYFARRYGAHAARWREVYALMSQSTENSQQMFGFNSLTWLLLQEQIWGSRFYTLAETVALIEKYRKGGVQDLPAAFSNRVIERALFRGLDESLALQEEARQKWEKLLAEDLTPAVRSRMESDAAWFQSTVSRYRLLAAAVDIIKARSEGNNAEPARTRALAEIAALSESPLTRDTISPVDQRAFLQPYRSLVVASLPGRSE